MVHYFVLSACVKAMLWDSHIQYCMTAVLHLRFHFALWYIGSPALKLAALQQVCNDLTEVETLKGCMVHEEKNTTGINKRLVENQWIFPFQLEW